MTGIFSVQSDRAGNFTRAQAAGAGVDILRGTVHDRLHALDIGVPGTVAPTMRVRNLDTKGNTLAAAFTFSHGTCTSCSEVRNQNNQLDYCSRLPGKMQAFFQKILRFFGKPNSFRHRCAMPAPSVREPLAKRKSFPVCQSLLL